MIEYNYKIIKYLLIIVIVAGCNFLGSDDNFTILSCHETREFTEPDAQCLFNTKVLNYRGIWYGQSKLDNEYRYKYAGGLGTYTNHHSPTAIYNRESNKTFFTYGGTHENYDFNKSHTIGPDQLYIMISFFDHNTKQLAEPTLVFDKWSNDPHDNPVLSIDSEGYIWLFAPSHGDITTPSYILKSKKPYDIDEFKVVQKSLFSYPQPHMNSNGDGLLFFTSYDIGRTLNVKLIRGDKIIDEKFRLSLFGKGHYQVSASNNSKIGTALNYHPGHVGADGRTNLYYLESDFTGIEWKNINGESIKIPLESVQNSALVRDYKSEGYLVYLMDIVYDNNGNPVILYNISTSYLPGGVDTKRYLKIAYYKDNEWHFSNITNTDHNYNMGTIYANENEWIITVPSKSGPQKGAAGGEIEMWSSEDRGSTWTKKKSVTSNSLLNHNYVRRIVNGKDNFAFIWASGHGYKPSESRLYYSDMHGTNVILMP